MNTTKILDNLIECLPIHFLKSPTLFVSDLHIGNGESYDNFKANYDLFLETFEVKYPTEPIIVVGDVHDLWECREDEIISYPPSAHATRVLKRTHPTSFIEGNHDDDGMTGIFYSEGLKLVDSSGLVGFCFHAHQIDFFNRGGVVSNVVGWLVRHIWTKFDVSPARNIERAQLIDNILLDYAKKKCIRIIAGHTHRPRISPNYVNCGTWTSKKPTTILYKDGEFSFV